MFRKPVIKSFCFILACLTLILPVNVFSADSGTTNNSWFERQGKFMIKNEIIKGDENGDYLWDSFVKRGDMALMIFRAFHFSSTDGESFTDVDSDSYYYDAITTARALGIAKGDGERFNPEDNVTLEEAILLVQRSATVAVTYNDAVRRQINLSDLYFGDNLTVQASRRDIANMLYYFLSDGLAYSQSTELSTIRYNTGKNTPIQFNAADFNDKFSIVSDKKLCFVILGLPESSNGVLYYDYKPSNSYNTLVAPDKRYYPDSQNGLDISKVTFIPTKDFSGTTTIVYTAGDGQGSTYSGKINITVDDSDSIINTINYTISKNSTKTFEVTDFKEAFKSVTDKELSYVMFTLPAFKYGKLYFNYNAATPELNTGVANGAKYYTDYLNNMALYKVTFVPYPDYTGSVVIEYTAYDKDNNLYKGKINITVE